MDTLDQEIKDEEEIVTSSTRYLSRSLNLDNLRYLQTLELKKLATFISKCRAFISVIGTAMLHQLQFYSGFERIVLLSEPNDCSLIAKFSSIEEFGGIALNVVNIPHPLRVHLERSTSLDARQRLETLNKINSTPLVVMLHGLGGQCSQFEQLIAILSQCADIFTLDLPGFGNSMARDKLGSYLLEYDSEEKSKMIKSLLSLPEEFFKTSNLTKYLIDLINLKRQNRKIILIGHSMGTHISLSVIRGLPEGVVDAVVLLSPPKINSELSYQKKKLGMLANFPNLFDIMRIWDRIGGLDSHSVGRQVFGKESFKRLRQLRWNLDVDSSIVLKYIKGFQPVISSELENAIHKINRVEQEKRVMILCGADDLVTPKLSSLAISEAIAFCNPSLELLANCGHSILLDKPETTSGLIYKFIESIPDININLGWCLQVKALISGDKWGLKNELKWKNLTNVSNPIKNLSTGEIAPLLSMKTLRESDDVHNTGAFEAKNPNIVAIVDISSDLPSYNPQNLQRIKYFKMPTVSKFIPDSSNIREFITLIDEILEDRTDSDRVVVHCHYGFNRTGFLICCYLIEKLGWEIDDAILAFKLAREPGIKHPHFIDGIYVRYK